MTYRSLVYWACEMYLLMKRGANEVVIGLGWATQESNLCKYTAGLVWPANGNGPTLYRHIPRSLVCQCSASVYDHADSYILSGANKVFVCSKNSSS